VYGLLGSFSERFRFQIAEPGGCNLWFVTNQLIAVMLSHMTWVIQRPNLLIMEMLFGQCQLMDSLVLSLSLAYQIFVKLLKIVLVKML